MLVDEWKPISGYVPGPYRGYDECVLIGWSDFEHGGVLGFDVAWRDGEGRWHSRRDGRGYGTQPDLFALVVTDIPNTMEGYVSSLRPKA